MGVLSLVLLALFRMVTRTFSTLEQTEIRFSKATRIARDGALPFLPQPNTTSHPKVKFFFLLQKAVFHLKHLDVLLKTPAGCTAAPSIAEKINDLF